MFSREYKEKQFIISQTSVQAFSNEMFNGFNISIKIVLKLVKDIIKIFLFKWINNEMTSAWLDIRTYVDF